MNAQEGRLSNARDLDTILPALCAIRSSERHSYSAGVDKVSKRQSPPMRRTMSPDHTKPPYSYYAPPRAVRVSAAALEMARTFGEQVARASPGQVIVFDWAISRGVRRRVDGPMEELGPGVDLVSLDARAVPSDVIQLSTASRSQSRFPRRS